MVVIAFWIIPVINVIGGIFDHGIILLNFPLNLCCRKSDISESFGDYVHTDNENIINHLAYQFVSNAGSCDSDKICVMFRNIVAHCVNRFIPVRRKRVGRQRPWITCEVIQLKQRLNRLSKWARDGSNTYLISVTCKQLERLLKKDKSYFIATVLSSFLSSSPQKFWHHIFPKRQKWPEGQSQSDEHIPD